MSNLSALPDGKIYVDGKLIAEANTKVWAIDSWLERAANKAAEMGAFNSFPDSKLAKRLK